MKLSKKEFFKNIGENYFYNIGSNFEISIKELCSKIANVTGFRGRIKFDKSKPNGTPRKFMSKRKISKIINLEFTNINIALKKLLSTI